VDITAFTDLQSPLAGDLVPRSTSSPACPLLSDDGVPIERISRPVGHTGTTVTETVYRHHSDR
jgi:hypothetical protein